MSSLKESIVGSRVLVIGVSPDTETIAFYVDRGPDTTGTRVVWDVDGDCCSHSWWNDAYELNSLRGEFVRDVRYIGLEDADDDDTDECVRQYGVEVVSDRGVTTFVFRNASNGYYGGDAYVGLDDPSRVFDEMTGSEWSA